NSIAKNVAEDLTNKVYNFDPMFVAPLASSDAPTTGGDYRLIAGSPAVGKGDNDFLSDIAKDLAGNTRIVGAIDLGAYERYNFEIAAADAISASKYIATEYSAFTIYSDGNATGQLSDAATPITAGSPVTLVKTFQTNKWYTIGFPFEIASVGIKQGDDISVAGDIYDHSNGKTTADDLDDDLALATTDNYFVMVYDGDVFRFTDQFEAGKAYIIEFPSDPFEYGETVEVTFTSTPNPALVSAGTVNVAAGYSLVANPGVANAAGSVFDGASYFYEYDLDDQHFDRINGGTSLSTDIKPFEAFIAYKGDAGGLRSAIGVGATETPVVLPAVITKDPVVRTEYYNLQGVRYSISLRNGLSAGTPYIVKETHQSGKVVSKVISGK
ncbi:MAG: hypothetical protein LBR66_05385, partial [Candidatus Symbiothrix sp.]|nr:hypothetical protein [Candidatus Symbiothrix sp.]